MHNPPPAGGHNPRGAAPSTRTPKVCPRVRSKNGTGRRLAVRIAMGCQIGALPCTPFASSRRFTHREACHWIRGSLLSPMNPVPLPPQGETRSMERKNRESYISCTIPQFPPLVVNAVSQSPACVSCHMTYKANPVTLTLCSSPHRAIPQPSARRAVKLKNPPAVRPVHPKNLFLHNPSTQPAAPAAPPLFPTKKSCEERIALSSQSFFIR